MIVTTIIVLVLLLLVNALFVAAEFAAVGARAHRITDHAHPRSRRAKILLSVLEDPARLDRYVSACQLGITITSLALGAVAGATLSNWLAPLLIDFGGMPDAAAHSVAVIIVLIGLSFVQMVVAEQTPKSLALQHPDSVAVSTVLPVAWALRLLGGLVRVLNSLSQMILRVFGVPAAAGHHLYSAEEIGMLITEGEPNGLEEKERERLRQALELVDLNARKIMIPRMNIEAVSVGTPVEKVLEQVLESPYTRLPVYRESIDDVIGAVNTRDLIPHLLSSIGAETELKDLLRPVVTVPEGMTADRLITAMREAGVKLAIVKDEFGGTSGLVTLEDVLAEILGDVADEFSAAELVPERFADGSFRLPGSMRLDEVEEWLGVEWEGTAATVGGYITDLFGHLPSPGEQVEIHSHVVEIERVSSKLVVSVMVTPSLREKPEADHG